MEIRSKLMTQGYATGLSSEQAIHKAGTSAPGASAEAPMGTVPEHRCNRRYCYVWMGVRAPSQSHSRKRGANPEVIEGLAAEKCIHGCEDRRLEGNAVDDGRCFDLQSVRAT